MSKPIVSNASDEEQQKKGKDVAREAELRYTKALQQVLATPEGKVVLWDLLGFCRTFASVWEGGAKISYNSGQQDVGHYLMDRIIRADPAAFLEMMVKNPR